MNKIEELFGPYLRSKERARDADPLGPLVALERFRSDRGLEASASAGWFAACVFTGHITDKDRAAALALLRDGLPVVEYRDGKRITSWPTGSSVDDGTEFGGAS